MKKPLRDWRMVGALSVLAAGAIAYNVILPLYADRLPADSIQAEARILAPEQPAADTDEVPSNDQSASVTRIRVTATEPMPRFTFDSIRGRDPFAKASATVAPRLAATMEIDPANPMVRSPSAAQLPAVTAIVVTDRWRAAVVDGRLVAPGGRVGDRVVSRIDLDAVQLRGTDQAPLSLAYSGATR